MAISASTNTSANTALRYLNQNSAASASSLAKLSSGSRIVKASDDAASLAVGTKIKADVTALKQAQVNASQASSVLQVADGGLAQTTDILMRMKALGVQAQSGSVSDNERGFLDKEFQALASQIDAIADQTKFNGNTLRRRLVRRLGRQ
jgi:flagellin